MLKTGDIVKHKDMTFMNTNDPLIGIVENVDYTAFCHVRVCDEISFSIDNRQDIIEIIEHRNFIYAGRGHLETHWELLC